jgi:cytochrome b6-f complex iron-sulfur subunit
MATASAAKAAATPKAEKAAEVAVSVPSRREFLYYIWGASMLLVTGEVTAGILWFAYPRFKAGEFGGTFTISPGDVPAVDTAPISKPEGRFWLSNPQYGFLALYGVCTHLGCLPKWVDTNYRFECPCHGSKYQITGKYIEGPAPRSLDRFKSTILFTDGSTAVTNAVGDPIPLNGRTIQEITVDTSSRIRRPKEANP